MSNFYLYSCLINDCTSFDIILNKNLFVYRRVELFDLCCVYFLFLFFVDLCLLFCFVELCCVEQCKFCGVVLSCVSCG